LQNLKKHLTQKEIKSKLEELEKKINLEKDEE
jgi:hypothetical protein